MKKCKSCQTEIDNKAKKCPHCQTFLKKPSNDLSIQLVMNSANPVKDESIFYGAGEYYIDSNSIGNYSMIVEDYK